MTEDGAPKRERQRDQYHFVGGTVEEEKRDGDPKISI